MQPGINAQGRRIRQAQAGHSCHLVTVVTCPGTPVTTVSREATDVLRSPDQTRRGLRSLLWEARTGIISEVMTPSNATAERELSVGNARGKAHHRHGASLSARERGRQRVRHWQATGDDAGAVGGAVSEGPVQ